MDYRKLYNQIIEKRRKEIPTGYLERHHVVPISFGGTDNKENIVRLTAREHFVCHLLLIKMNPTGRLHYKAIHAFMMMSVSSNIMNRITSRIFEKYRIEQSKIMSEHQSGKKNSNYGKMWITNVEEEKKIFKDEEIPEGWTKGRSKRVKDMLKQHTSPNKGKKLGPRSNDTKGRISKKLKEYYKNTPVVNKKYGSKLDTIKSEFIELYLQNESINKSLQYFGKICAGGNYIWAKAVLQENNIEIKRRKK